MKSWKLAILGLSLGMWLQACGQKVEPETECNFVQNSQFQRVSWANNLPVKMYIHSSVPSQYYAAIKSAMDRWDRALGSRKVFEIVGIINQGTSAAQDGVSAIYYRNQWDQGRTGEQARTTIFWRGDMLSEADVQINAQDFAFFAGQNPVSGAVDIESLFVHELGHALGLSHNDGSGSVMATHLAASHLRREPSKNDIDSLRCEY